MKPAVSQRSSSSSTSPANPKRPRASDSSGPSTSPSVPRITQRAPQSCLECTRRKIKCDKEQPCRACISRGEAATCRREAVLVKGAILSGPEKTVSLQSLSAELEELRERVALLEGHRPTEIGIYSRAHSPRPTNLANRLPSAMEEAALGIGEARRWMGSAIMEKDPTTTPNPWFQPQSFEFSLSQLPSQPQARTLAQYYMDNLAWTMGVMHAPTFWSEFNDFWTKLEHLRLKDDVWLGVLFAVLSVAAYFIEEQDANRQGYSLEQIRHLALTWFNAALATSFRCHLLTEHTLTQCQLIQVLCPAFHLSGNTTLHQSLTFLGRGMSRDLNLQLLGDRRDEQEIRKDIGRRIWWNDVEGDWAFLPYNRHSVYLPHQFNTAMPKPFENEPGGLLYREIAHRTSRLLYDVYGMLAAHETPSYDRVLGASKAMQALREGITTQTSVTQTRLVHMTLAYRSYQIHRLFYIRSLQSTDYAPSKTACLAAAETILAVAEAGLHPTFYLMWNVAVMMVAAGIVKALELIHADWSERLEVQRARVHGLIDRLRGLQDQSGIATRGAALIDHLLIMEAQLRAGHRNDIQLSREAILDIVQSSLNPKAPEVPVPLPLDQFNPDVQSLPFGAELDLALLWDDFFPAS